MPLIPPTESYLWNLAARLCLAYASSAAAAVAVHALARRAAPGSAARAAVCLPAAAALLAVPSFVTDPVREAMSVVPVVGIYSLAAFKVLAFAVGRGPLQTAALPSLLEFGTALALPVIPKDAFERATAAATGCNGATKPAPPTPASAFLRSYALKTAATLAVIAACYSPRLPVLALHWLYALTLSLAMGAIWDAYCAAAAGLCGLDVAHSFDAPWLSSSFSDYWSRRWNLTTSYMLRVLVYDPVLQGRLVAVKEGAAAAAGREQPEVAGRGAGGNDNGEAAAAAAGNGSAPGGLQQRGRLKAPEAADDSTAAAPAGDATSGRSGGGSAGAGDAAAAANGSSGAGGAAGVGGGGDAKQQGRRNRPGLKRRLLALHATFLFSGIWHMFIWAHFRTGSIGWRWLAFFIVQGPIVAGEAALKALWLRRWGLPPLPRGVSVPLTNFLLIVVAEPLFFGPCDAAGICGRMLGASEGGPPAARAKWAAAAAAGAVAPLPVQ